MMMMDYGSQYTGSTIGSDTMSESVLSRQSRVRTIRLVRPTNGTLPAPGLTCRHGPNLGFSVRGGREHGTGFFISNVELGSEAHRQGLRVGDQIIRVNGFTVDDAVHKEVLQLISNHTHLTLKVRSVGMIPVKDKKTDPLSWQIISDCGSSSRSSPQLSEKIHDVRISIIVAPRTKLGCGICKGPEWKPGIFIQFTKEGGIAREAGLRPGDQILFCNNVDFSDIAFNEAVNLMKSSRQLDLIVRKSAGSELFPGESSGYNSSASSVTGDQSPSWSDSKRLSIVKEESMELEDRLSNLDRFNSKKWEKIEWDDSDLLDDKPYFKPTIINLSESGTTIKNNGTEDCEKFDHETSNKIADICLVSHQHEMKTVVVEVHRSDMDEKAKMENNNKVVKTPSTDSFSSSSSRSSTVSSSLSNAICQEILRRNEKNQSHNDKPTIDEQLQMKKIIKNVDNDKQQQHSKLMDEFKKAHRKMFQVDVNDNKTKEAEVSSSKASLAAANKDTMDRNSSIEFSKNVSERLASLSVKEAPQEKSTTSNRLGISASTVTTPPPPPPLPNQVNGNKNGDMPPKQPSPHQPKTKPKAPPPPPPIRNGTAPPPCPPPDYDTISISSTNSAHLSSTLKKPLNGLRPQNALKPSQTFSDSVEMESLESFKLNQPSNSRPKPPNTYFSKPPLGSQLSNGSIKSNGSATLMKSRPVSVTIGEYPSGTSRKQPNRFDFLPNGGQDKVDGSPVNQPITNQLATELAQTLNRSNLKKRTESMENLLNMSQIKAQKNGSVRISVNSSLGRHLAKSTNDLRSLSSISKALANRVTISIPSVDRKADTINGILKNGNSNSNSNHVSAHRPVVHQKSITFGELPIVINDLPLRVT